jgi:hypothetical protein
MNMAQIRQSRPDSGLYFRELQPFELFPLRTGPRLESGGPGQPLARYERGNEEGREEGTETKQAIERRRKRASKSGREREKEQQRTREREIEGDRGYWIDREKSFNFKLSSNVYHKFTTQKYLY